MGLRTSKHLTLIVQNGYVHYRYMHKEKKMESTMFLLGTDKEIRGPALECTNWAKQAVSDLVVLWSRYYVFSKVPMCYPLWLCSSKSQQLGHWLVVQSSLIVLGSSPTMRHEMDTVTLFSAMTSTVKVNLSCGRQIDFFMHCYLVLRESFPRSVF